jgi:hypothetical protein
MGKGSCRTYRIASGSLMTAGAAETNPERARTGRKRIVLVVMTG